MDKLLPCPFCGGEAKIGSLGDSENWLVWCQKCQIPHSETGLQGDTKEQIIKAWNTRTPRLTVEQEKAIEEIARTLKRVKGFEDVVITQQSAQAIVNLQGE